MLPSEDTVLFGAMQMAISSSKYIITVKLYLHLNFQQKLMNSKNCQWEFTMFMSLHQTKSTRFYVQKGRIFRRKHSQGGRVFLNGFVNSNEMLGKFHVSRTHNFLGFIVRAASIVILIPRSVKSVCDSMENQSEYCGKER